MRKMEREDPNSNLIIPSVKAIRRIVSKFREEGTIQNKPNRGGQPAKIVEAKALEVKQLLAENPDSNLKQIAEKAKIAITSLRRLTEIYPEQMKEAKARMKYLKNKKEGQKMFVRFCPSQSDYEEKMNQIKQLLVEHPTYTAAQIAAIVGCNRKNKCLVDVRKKFLQEHNIKIPKIKTKKSKNISTNYNSTGILAQLNINNNSIGTSNVNAGTNASSNSNNISHGISINSNSHSTSTQSVGTGTSMLGVSILNVAAPVSQQSPSIATAAPAPKKRSRTTKPKTGLIDWPQIDLDEIMHTTSNDLDVYSNDQFATPTSSNHASSTQTLLHPGSTVMYASQPPHHQQQQIYYQNQIQFAVSASTQQLQTMHQQQQQQTAPGGSYLTPGQRPPANPVPLTHHQQAYINIPQHTFTNNLFYHK
jgi:transposase